MNDIPALLSFANEMHFESDCQKLYIVFAHTHTHERKNECLSVRRRKQSSLMHKCKRAHVKYVYLGQE